MIIYFIVYEIFLHIFTFRRVFVFVAGKCSVFFPWPPAFQGVCLLSFDGAAPPPSITVAGGQRALDAAGLRGSHLRLRVEHRSLGGAIHHVWHARILGTRAVVGASSRIPGMGFMLSLFLGYFIPLALRWFCFKLGLTKVGFWGILDFASGCAWIDLLRSFFRPRFGWAFLAWCFSSIQGFYTDVWALGCLFYEILVSHPPFCSRDEAELRQKVGYLRSVMVFFKGFRGSIERILYNFVQDLVKDDHWSALKVVCESCAKASRK